MMRVILIILTLLLVQKIWAQPKCIDSNNFGNSLICKESRIIKKFVDGRYRKTINTKLGAIIDADDVEDEKELFNIFLDFNAWGMYAQREGSETVRFRSSRKLATKYIGNREVLRHYTHFATKAPAPLYYQWVRAVINYWKIDPVHDSLVSYRFISDKGKNQIKGEEVLFGSEGMRHYEGVLSIFFDAENMEYIVYTEFWLVPVINILPEFAIPPIERGLIALVKGMFEL